LGDPFRIINVNVVGEIERTQDAEADAHEPQFSGASLARLVVEPFVKRKNWKRY
jgi:hypothetical protein